MIKVNSEILEIGISSEAIGPLEPLAIQCVLRKAEIGSVGGQQAGSRAAKAKVYQLVIRITASHPPKSRTRSYKATRARRGRGASMANNPLSCSVWGASVAARVTARSLALACSNDPHFDRWGPSFSAALCSLHSSKGRKKLKAASELYSREFGFVQRQDPFEQREMI
ncbi:hypothetical protein C8R44DRAFT_753182 [Mycena epipterygia]|nr:hypothetical protein C8R44DRAFT_753182 [Mycena epipterygia]